MKTRRPVPAVRCLALPRIDRFAASLAIGGIALVGCKNPFDVSQTPTSAESSASVFDPTAGLASVFATTSIATHADPHPTYPLLTVLAAQTALYAHAAEAAATPPVPTVPPPAATPISTFVGGAMAIGSVRPIPPRHIRGGVRRVGP